MDAELAYVFRHALLREAAYQLQMPADRARLHALVVEIIEPTLGNDEDGALASELAEHAKNAGEQYGAREVAFRRRAIEHALGRLDYGEVLRQSELVAAHAAATPLERARAVQRIGDAQRQRGFAREALATYDRLLTAFPDLPAKQRGSVIRAKADARYRLGQIAEAESDYQEAIRLLETGADRQGVATAYGNYGLLLSATGRQELAERYFRDAITQNHSEGAFHEAAFQEVNLANVLLDRGEARQALALMQNSRLRQRVHDPAVCGTESLALSALGRKEEALEAIRRALEISRQNGQRLSEGVSLANLGSQLAEGGRLEEAAVQLELAVTVLEEIGARRSCACARASWATTMLEMGRIDDAFVQWEICLSTLRAVGAWPFLGRELSSKASDCLKVGDVLQAKRCLDEARPLLTYPSYSSWLASYFYPPLVRLHAHENNRVALDEVLGEIRLRFKESDLPPALTSAMEFATAADPHGARLFGYRVNELTPALRGALPRWWEKHNPALLAQLKAHRPKLLESLSLAG